MINNPALRSIVEDRQKHLDSIGLLADDVKHWGVNWRNLKSRAKRYGRLCELSFEEYTRLASEAGIEKASEVGIHEGAFQLGRYKDEGDYILGNCRFIVKEENLKERWIYKGCKKK